MNKKNLLLWLSCVLSIVWLFINVSYAQEYTEADMKAVYLDFCGDGTGASTYKSVVYIEPGDEKTIRLCVNNTSTKKMFFEYWFSESGIWNGRYCQGNMWTGNKFSMLIPWTKERKVMIEPMTKQVIEEKIVIPPGMSWLQLGCLGYNLLKPENTLVGWMFALKIRKILYIDIMVWGESAIKSSIKVVNMTWGIFSTNKKVKAVVDEKNNLKLNFLIENKWNIAQNITITGKVNNSLWFQQDFSITTKTMAPGSTNEFTADVGILPSYKWFFTINFNVKNDPQFMFPITNEKLKISGYISDTWRIFIFSWIRIVILVVWLLILYKIFVPRRVKIVTV